MHTPPLILVVDDEPDLLDISKMRLEAAGFQVETAIDAETSFIKARKIKPDLVLMDIRMPGINGTEALLDYKNDPDLKDIHVAFLTSLAIPWPGVSVENESFAKELGAVTFLDKTKDLDNLPELTKKILAEIHKGDLIDGINAEISKIKPDHESNGQ